MKNLLLFSSLLLFSAGAFAQLTVKPTGTQDSYIYVKDQIIYVKEDIKLQKNTNNSDTEASIYLREGAQLIQEDPDAKNSGDGFLSVQQSTNPTNAYAYYYWCSPVGEAAGPPENTNFGLGNIYEDQNNSSPGVGTKARPSISIPQKEGYSDPLTISRRWMYIHPTPSTEAEDTYTRINASYGAPAGFGFTMKGVNKGTSAGDPGTGTNHQQLYEFRGRPNNGNFEIPVLGPAYAGSGPTNAEANMTLTGNPYPSALDLQAVFNDPDNEALNSIFYYDEDRDEMSHLYRDKPFGYGVWVPTGGGDGVYTQATFFIWKSDGSRTGSGTGANRPDIPKRYAPIGQGFMMVGKNTDSANVIIKNSHRAFKKEGTESVFFRPTAGDDQETVFTDTNSDPDILASDNDTRIPQLRLYVIFDNALTRDMLLVFSPQATDGYDRGFDGLSPGGMKSDAYFPIGPDSNRLPYVIQGTNYHPRKQIPISFKLHKTSQIDVRAVEEIRKPYQKAYLFDKQENTYRPLIKQGSATSTFTLPAGTYEDRFYIVFRETNSRPTGDEDQLELQNRVAGNVDFFQNNPAQQLEVLNPERYTLKSASLYDMNGKLVLHKTDLGDNPNYSFYTGNLSDGVYLVKLLTSENVSIDYKAIVVNR